ncbi:response regulator transcription factor [Candidatus Uhrbacteria bacterium]|nr:response regulator transcription factor [Candidatus Uhrbacteria bacterium]
MAKVLFADDQAALYNSIPQKLRAMGHEVSVIKKAAEAYDYIKLHASEIDLLISDWSFPGEVLNGGDLLKTYRSLSASPAIAFSSSPAAKMVARDIKAEFAGKDADLAVELAQKLLA